ncbi:MAG: hypothetical protein AMJ69_12130 [Gammaproteobacteria bacterium SG8_47]|nr:MAG: hypothetical protein AMJ69_12130 [Gammaproteobacteria bacterium SG8_47]
MGNAQTRAIAEDYLGRMSRGDFDGCVELLSPKQFRYVGPTVQFDKAIDYLADISRVGGILKGARIRRMVVEENEAFVAFDVLTTLEELACTRVAQWMRVHDGRIVEIEVFFDARAYAMLFAG